MPPPPSSAIHRFPPCDPSSPNGVLFYGLLFCVRDLSLGTFFFIPPTQISLPLPENRESELFAARNPQEDSAEDRGQGEMDVCTVSHCWAPASSFVSSLLEVLALVSRHMNQWDLRPEGSLGRKNQRSSTVQSAFIEPPGPVCWSCWRGEAWLK